MPNTKRQLALASLLAVLLYLIPNLVQDIHRVFGHHGHHSEKSTRPGKQIHESSEKCTICTFEFTVFDEIEHPLFAHVHQTVSLLLGADLENQVHNEAFYYCNLRAPPQA